MLLVISPLVPAEQVASDALPEHRSSGGRRERKRQETDSEKRAGQRGHGSVVPEPPLTVTVLPVMSPPVPALFVAVIRLPSSSAGEQHATDHDEHEQGDLQAREAVAGPHRDIAATCVASFATAIVRARKTSLAPSAWSSISSCSRPRVLPRPGPRDPGREAAHRRTYQAGLEVMRAIDDQESRDEVMARAAASRRPHATAKSSPR